MRRHGGARQTGGDQLGQIFIGCRGAKLAAFQVDTGRCVAVGSMAKGAIRAVESGASFDGFRCVVTDVVLCERRNRGNQQSGKQGSVHHVLGFYNTRARVKEIFQPCDSEIHEVRAVEESRLRGAYSSHDSATAGKVVIGNLLEAIGGQFVVHRIGCLELFELYPLRSVGPWHEPAIFLDSLVWNPGVVLGVVKQSDGIERRSKH